MNKKRLFNIISYIWLAVLVIILLVFLYRYFDLEISDDSGAEMILSYLVSKGGILSKEWYYSTELRVFNTQLVYGLLFRFMDNWHAVRIAGNGIMYVILIAAVYYLTRQISLEKYTAYISALLLIPISYDYYINALHSSYLLPHITASILLMAMYLNVIKCNDKRRRNLLLGILLVFSLIIGLGGMRHLLVFFAPLMVSVVFVTYKNRENIKKYIFPLIVSILISASSFVGFVINSFILKKIYTFSAFYINDRSFFSDFDPHQFLNVFNGTLKAYGYQTGKSIFSFSLIANVLPVVLIAMIAVALKSVIIAKCQNEYQVIIGYFFIFGMIIITLLFSFSTMPYADRYLVPVTVFAFPLIFVAYDNLNDVKYKAVILAVMCLFITVVSLYNYRELSKQDVSEESRRVTDILVDKEYYKGYSFMYGDYGDSVTEYSDGKIEVWKKTWGDETKELSIDDMNNTMQWLQYKSHTNEQPEGKVFLILPREVEFLDDGIILYSSDKVVVYGYDNADILWSEF